ncbi:hypothetical protein [Amaricoccus sp.]|uniref:hypothetical protein n=1 Tax=Amaricoccus sp. TaxID=1872485 RepID=UPI001B43871F|nr:hypothetical protein [Amaricoccus sp.]MBP6999906.1 hypothetical protein [Amaricoccus sp.]
MRDDGRTAGGWEDAPAALHIESPALEARLREARAQRAAALARKPPPRFASGLAARLGRARPGLGVGAERGDADLPPRLAAVGSEDAANAFDTYPATPLRREARSRPAARRRGSVLLAAGLAFAAGAALTWLAGPFFRSDVPAVVVLPEGDATAEAPAAATSEPAASSQAVVASPVEAPESGPGTVVIPVVPAVDALARAEAPGAEGVAPMPVEDRPAVEAKPEQGFAPASGAAAPVGGAMPEAAPEGAAILDAAAPEDAAALEAAAPESVAAPETDVVREAAPAAPAGAATLRAAAPLPRPQGLAARTEGALQAPGTARDATVAPVSVAAPGGAALPAPDASAALPLFSGAGQPPAAFEDAPRADPGIAVWLPEQPTARPAAKSRRRGAAPAPEPVVQPQKPDNIFSAARRDFASGFRRLDSGFSAAARRVERGIGSVLPGPSERPAAQPEE